MGALTFNDWSRRYTPPEPPNWRGGAYVLAGIVAFSILVFVLEKLC